MQRRIDNQIALFVRDERTGRYVFNAQALRTLGIDPAEARRINQLGHGAKTALCDNPNIDSFRSE